MHNDPKSMKDYHDELQESLENSFLRQTLDNFAIAYKANRETVFEQIDAPAIIDKIAQVKDYVSKNYHALFEEFKANAEARGVIVHLAKTAHEANEIIAQIAKENNVKNIIKSKSMTTEETMLNAFLQASGLVVDETDLGEWIIQLRGEGPSHMVMPAIHLSRHQVAQDFSKATGIEQSSEIDHLVKIARKQLRPKFIAADMGITGANFAVAETGSIALVTNEGNARLVTTLPRVHVAVMGLDKLVPTLDDALNALLILPRNATAQMLTAYVTWINGACDCASAENNKKITHFVFVDNGRSAIAKDELFSQIFRCVRCGACANVCPIYRLVGGHKMGYIYIGAIGLILTYFFHGEQRAKILAQNCINCEACKNICAGGIDLPHLIAEIRKRLNEHDGPKIESTLLNLLMKNRKVFHSLLKFAKFAQYPSTRGTAYQRHLPAILFGKQGFKELPAIAINSFRDNFNKNQFNIDNATYNVAIFAGCAQDFIYPEQLEAAIKVLKAHDVAVHFPYEQTCCGLPLEMLGQRETSINIAMQNINAFSTKKYDAIITLCASCASHLKHTYPMIIKAKEMEQNCNAFANKIMNFSTFMQNILDQEKFHKSHEQVTYHSACHLRAEHTKENAAHKLIELCANYIACAEDNVCCGFGGTYSLKFPEISANLLENKLKNLYKTNASSIVVDCPGCIMQLRGGIKKHNNNLQVKHIAELLAENLKT